MNKNQRNNITTADEDQSDMRREKNQRRRERKQKQKAFNPRRKGSRITVIRSPRSNREIMRIKWTIGTYIGCILAIGFIGYRSIHYVKYMINFPKFVEYGVETQAYVYREIGVGPGGTNRLYTYEVDGIVYKGETGTSCSYLHVGDVIDIVYLPSDPSIKTIDVKKVRAERQKRHLVSNNPD